MRISDWSSDVCSSDLLRDQRRANADHQPTQHDDAHDAPEKHPVLIETRNGKGREDQRDDKDVVERQRLFDEVAGEEFEALFMADHLSDTEAEDAGNANISRRSPEAFPTAYFPVVFVKNAEIECQQGGDDEKESPTQSAQ